MNRVKQLLWFIGLTFTFAATAVQASDSLDIAASEFPPYEYSGQPLLGVQGFSADLIRSVLKRMNVKIKRHAIYPWKRGLVMVYRGELDAIHSASTTKERLEYCWFPQEPLTTSSKVFLIKKENLKKLKYESYEDFIGYTIGIVRGFSYPEDFLSFVKTQGNYHEVVKIEQLFDMLRANRLDYIVSEANVANNFIKLKKLQNEIAILNKPLQIKPMFLIFSKKRVNKSFVDKFSVELKSFKYTDEFFMLCKKYDFECDQRK